MGEASTLPNERGLENAEDNGGVLGRLESISGDGLPSLQDALASLVVEEVGWRTEILAQKLVDFPLDGQPSFVLPIENAVSGVWPAAAALEDSIIQ